MSNIPTVRDSAIEAVYQEAVLAGYELGKRAFLEAVKSKSATGDALRKQIEMHERTISADRQYRIADAIMREVKPT